MRTRYALMTVGLILTLVTTLALPALAAPGHSGGHAPLYYVALGDSLSVGIQPDATGVNHPTAEGYADQLHAALQVAMPTLRLVKLGCPGETTLTMITGGTCAYPKRSQLAEAVAFLHAHRQFVALVTLDIGADDVLPCAAGNTIDQVCLAAAFGNTAAHLPTIVTALREAVGPDVPIVALNYYDPFLAAWLQGPAGQALAALSDLLLLNFNSVLGGVYGQFAVPVADVATAFHSTDFTLIFVPGFGQVPLNVLFVCEWTWMCVPAPVGPNIHPNRDGYGVLTQAILAVLP